MYAVIDTETTGLNIASDRIIELAVIGLDEYGNKEWEWCSLINPGRDTGSGLAIRAHQIYSRDVADAPYFSDFAGHIRNILCGRALIAHNAPFDLGMLGAEYQRLGVKIPPLVQICTARLARDCGFRPWRLDACCSMLGIEMEGMHHALADARATLHLAQNLLDFSHDGARREISAQISKQMPWPEFPIVKKDPLARPILPCRQPKASKRIKSDGAKPSKNVTPPTVHTIPVVWDSPETRYLAAVETVLEDRVITTEQRQTLESLKYELQLSDEKVQEMHMTFIRGLAGSMWDDGEISRHERYDLEVVAESLALKESDIEHAIQYPIGLDLLNDDSKLQAGARVVFTGEMSLSRSEWTERAKAVGLRVTKSISSKTDYLVVPFGETGSTKSRKARELGVRVISEQRFLRMIKRLEQSLDT